MVFADGRVRVRSASVKRFDRRYRRMRWEVNHKLRVPADLTMRVRAWVAHTAHAQSYGFDTVFERDVYSALAGRLGRTVPPE